MCSGFSIYSGTLGSVKKGCFVQYASLAQIFLQIYQEKER